MLLKILTMSLLKILIFPDSRLRTVAKPIERVDDEVKRLSSDMLETMYEGGGVGLAATQVDIHRRLIVVDVSEEKNKPIILINPKAIKVSSERKKLYEEGCLSVPGFYEEVERPYKIKINALNEKGAEVYMDLEDIESVVVQHEMDHLDGKMFVDYLSGLKRLRIKQKLLKTRKEQSNHL